MTDLIYEELRRMERSGNGRADMVTAEISEKGKKAPSEKTPQDKKA